MIVVIVFNRCDKRGCGQLQHQFPCIEQFGEKRGIRIGTVTINPFEHKL